jgi:hypothetical protein
VRWTGTCLLACSIAVPAWPQAIDPGTPPSEPPAAPRAAPTASVPEAAPETPADTSAPPDPSAGPGLRWGLSPIQWGGSVAYGLRVDHTGNSSRETEHQLSTTLNGLTYIYQPWFAIVSGTVSVTRGHTIGSGDLPSLHDDFTTGALRLGMFPRSRFPLDVRYEVSDSRTDSSLAGGVDYRSHLFAVTQQYRPASGDFNLRASYERRTQNGPTFGEDSQEALMADFSTRWKRHSLAASVSRSVNRRGSTDEEADFRSAVLRHTYGAGSDFTVETSANWAQTDDRLLIAGGSQALTQWSSVALYRPEGTGLTVSGSVRGFEFDIGDQPSTRTTALALGAAYDFSRNLRMSASAAVTKTDGTTAQSWVGALAGTYQGDSRRLGELQYDWQAGAAVSQSRSEGLQDTTVSTQLGHTMSRTWPTGPGTSWTANLAQTISTAYTRSDVDTPTHPLGWSRALTQTAGLTWLSSGPDRNAYARLSASDARQFDGERARFQLINLQVSGNYEIDRYRGWSGDLSYQRVFQRAVAFQGTGPDPFGLNRTITHTASGEISWHQLRLFDVPRLRFVSRLRVSSDALYQRDVLLAIPDREGVSWENRLDYLIGQLEASATLRLAKFDGVARETLLLRVQRNF